ncbi:hypothetical protein AK812_SmicGene35800 [Symbiodinium microadriaticum]|uniref:PH domain-containing protein n=1 Tax=Symbiodinium microadriaticum TaxID=2951 RepID=A0A1Q9CKN2_SYMMI|nr:hypothetical protein AK812_SmicGene35800 [Symbiodinium microadriaticum]
MKLARCCSDSAECIWVRSGFGHARVLKNVKFLAIGLAAGWVRVGPRGLVARWRPEHLVLVSVQGFLFFFESEEPLQVVHALSLSSVVSVTGSDQAVRLRFADEEETLRWQQRLEAAKESAKTPQPEFFAHRKVVAGAGGWGGGDVTAGERQKRCWDGSGISSSFASLTRSAVWRAFSAAEYAVLLHSWLRAAVELAASARGPEVKHSMVLSCQVPVQAAAWDAEGLDTAWRRAAAAEALRRHQAPTCGGGRFNNDRSTCTSPEDVLDNVLDTNLALVQDCAQENRARSPARCGLDFVSFAHGGAAIPRLRPLLAQRVVQVKLKKSDGVFTTANEEVALWRSVMVFLHDAVEEEEEEDEEEHDDSSPLGEVLRRTLLIPVPGAISPAEVPATSDALVAPTTGWRAVRCFPADLLNAPPGRRGLPAVDLDLLSTKATLLAKEFGQVVGGDWHATKMDASDAADAQKEIQAIGDLILARGGKDCQEIAVKVALQRLVVAVGT